MSDIFKDIEAYVIPSGIGKARVDFFKSKLTQNGACIITENQKFTALPVDKKVFVIFEQCTFDTWTSLDKALAKKNFYMSLKDSVPFQFISTAWLSKCLEKKSFVPTDIYEMKPKSVEKIKSSSKRTLEETTSSRKKPKLIEPVTPPVDLNISSGAEDIQVPKLDIESWSCAHSSKEQPVNLNKTLTDKLEELSQLYDVIGQKFKVTAYQKAVVGLKQCDHQITTLEVRPLSIFCFYSLCKACASCKEAKAVPGVGSSLAEHLVEIIQTGTIQKLEELNARDDIAALKVFTNIYGVGPTIAQTFVRQGFRTLSDLTAGANLTKNQKLGVKYYDDFLQRIPRDEATLIEQTVKEAAFSLNSGLIITTCGSYRRGKPTCGDVDILISHPDGQSHKNIFSQLLDLLHNQGFLTDDLAVQEESTAQRKYLGVCKLPGENKIHRRLDIIVVPYAEYGCALLYFTGSAHFNRSMRHLASKLGMSLSEHGLNKNVIRKGTKKVNEGVKLKTPREEDVFKCLNLKFRPPEERDF